MGIESKYGEPRPGETSEERMGRVGVPPVNVTPSSSDSLSTEAKALISGAAAHYHGRLDFNEAYGLEPIATAQDTEGMD